MYETPDAHRLLYINSKGVLTVLLTSSAGRQMRFNPCSEAVVLYNDVATKFTLLLVTFTAWENGKYGSARSARTQEKGSDVMSASKSGRLTM